MAVVTNAEGTEVDAINKSAGVAPVAVHEDVRAVVKAALRFAELCTLREQGVDRTVELGASGP